MKAVTYATCILLPLFAGALAAQEESPAAFIEEIHGKASLKSGNSGLQPLDSKIDVGRILQSGDFLECPPGVVRGVTIDNIRSKTLSNLCRVDFSTFGSGSNRLGRRSNPLEGFQDFILAGRDKATETAIFNPPNAGAVLAEKLLVRWRVRPPLDKFTAILQDGIAELARVPDVDGAKGELDSVVLQQALERVRDSGHQLRLVFKFDRGSDQSVTFSVLSSAQETQLQGALANVYGQTGLLSHVERAGIYDSFRIYGMVASEYDAALTEAPDSRDILRASLQAHTRIGDLRRAREVRDKLQKVEGAHQP